MEKPFTVVSAVIEDIAWPAEPYLTGVVRVTHAKV